MANQLTPGILTNPYSVKAEEYLRKASLGHRFSFTLTTHAGLEIPLTLGTAGATLTFDENWAPYAQFDGTFYLPKNTELEQINPRLKETLTIQAGYVLPEGTDIHALATLELRGVQDAAPDQWLNITASSRECLYQDLTIDRLTIPTSGLAALDVIIGEPISASGIKDVSLTNLETDPTVTRWDMALAIASQLEAWLRCDPVDGWKLTPRPSLDTPVLTLNTGPTGIITSWTRTIDRELWAENVIVKAGEVYGRAGEQNPRRTAIFTTDAVLTEAGANAMAQSLLPRYKARGLTLELSAKSAYWIRPGHTVNISIPALETRARVSRVAFNLPAGNMNLTVVFPESEIAK